jgi:hypothetical protein
MLGFNWNSHPKNALTSKSSAEVEEAVKMQQCNGDYHLNVMVHLEMQKWLDFLGYTTDSRKVQKITFRRINPS